MIHLTGGEEAKGLPRRRSAQYITQSDEEGCRAEASAREKRGPESVGQLIT